MTITNRMDRILNDVPVEWWSDDPAVASVDADGRIRSVGEGTATITAQAGMASSTVTVTVLQKIHTLVLSASTTYLTPDETLHIIAEARDKEDSAVERAATSWLSDNELVAVVDSEGRVMAVSVGRTQVTATAGNVSATVQVTVVDDTDREVLVALYNETGGSDWMESSGWLSNKPLDEWANVVTSPATGRVTQLNLESNRLTGGIPQALGSLTELEVLRLKDNSLTGKIPLELGNLHNLRVLDLSNNNLIGTVPAELGELRKLETLDFFSNELWGELPSALGDLRLLRHLALDSNRFSGVIPSELGNLDRLENMFLKRNRLFGEIPGELGNLGSLRNLNLDNNELSGKLPPELGNLTSLVNLNVGWNQISGEVPPELGRLSSLRELILAQNRLVGGIPPELSRLHNLELLSLRENSLSGDIPSDLGALTQLQTLRLEKNLLTGLIPPEFGDLVNLEVLYLHTNDLAGKLPTELTRLSNLKEFFLYETQVCVPSDEGIRNWLRDVEQKRIAMCEADYTASGVAVYLTQPIQSLDYTVPLVADETALLRVFITSSMDSEVNLPPLRASFFHEGNLVHTSESPGQNTGIPKEVNEGNLSESVNLEVPASIVVPGLEMVLEISPYGTTEPNGTTGLRIPDTGRIAVEVFEVPPLELTLVPFLWNENPDYALVSEIEALTTDHEVFESIHDLLPVSDIDLAIHEPVWTSYEPNFLNSLTLLQETEKIRIIEGSPGYYMGIHSDHGGGWASVDVRPSSVSALDRYTMAHELGHNFSLAHAPCGSAPFPDPLYPYNYGIIGVWGFDTRTGSLVPPRTRDLMGYCGWPDDYWISDYSFVRAMNHRQLDEPRQFAMAQSSTLVLLVSGGVDENQNLFLEPAFVINAPPSLASSSGPYQLTGEDAQGNTMFVMDFAMSNVADAPPNVSLFTFALPVDSEWAEHLEQITLSGQGDTVFINSESDRNFTLILDQDTRRVRGFLRDWPSQDTSLTAARRQLPEPGLRFLISSGVPRSADWRE